MARISVVVVALAAAVFVLLGTRHGIGEGNDSSHYLSTATNLRSVHRLDVAFSSPFDPVPVAKSLDHGAAVPLTHFPPGYPIVIAAVDVVTPGGVGAAARVVGALTLSLLAMVAALLAQRLGARGAMAPALVAVCVAASPAVLNISRWAMSDALATTLALTAVAIAAGARHDRDHRALYGAATVAAIAALTRYAGAAASVAVVVLFDRAALTWRSRIRSALVAVAPTIVAVAAFLAVGKLRHGDAARPVAWHPPGGDDLRAFVRTIGSWAVGERSDTAVRLAAVAIVGVTMSLAFSLRAARTTPRSSTHGSLGADASPSPARVAAALATFGVAHTAILIITSTWLDTEVGTDRRLLLPVELVVVAFLASRLLVACGARQIAAAIALVALVTARALTPTGALPEGIGSPPPAHGPNALYAHVLDLPREAVLLTNAPEAMWRESRRGAIYAPSPYDKLTGRFADPNTLTAALVEMGRLGGARGAVLVIERVVIFGLIAASPRLLSPPQIAAALPCARVVVEIPEGLLYDLTPCAQS